MLLTRCPDCDTTFRVTDETLKKANGQVRCGRCASVFNAYAELQDADAKSHETPPPTSVLTAPQPPETTATAEPPKGDAAPTAPPETAVVAEDFEGISAHEVDEVLTSTATAAQSDGPPSWPAFGTEPERQPASRWWTAAVALAVVALGAQALHYFRADVAGHPTFGPLLQDVYARFGTELTPRWDVRQYEILDWVATAEPNERGLGSLKITARIQNRGPLRQPYPAVQLRLKDRWDKAVSSRMFTPAEYLARESSSERLMAPGETTRAEMEVVDPGPDAYGFELDVCIEVEASLVTCGTDEVFL
jgi:predicted Zn finger-like uncharacterized protein